MENRCRRKRTRIVVRGPDTANNKCREVLELLSLEKNRTVYRNQQKNIQTHKYKEAMTAQCAPPQLTVRFLIAFESWQFNKSTVPDARGSVFSKSLRRPMTRQPPQWLCPEWSCRISCPQRHSDQQYLPEHHRHPFVPTCPRIGQLVLERPVAGQLSVQT